MIFKDYLCIVTQEKAWMHERVMMVWYEEIWLKYFRERTKKRFYQLVNVKECV